jgi:hypothetical protein
MCIYPIPSPPTTSIRSNVIIDIHVHNTQNVEIIFFKQKTAPAIGFILEFFLQLAKK